MKRFANINIFYTLVFIFIFFCISGNLGTQALLANPSGVISSQGVGSIQGLGTKQVTIQQTAPKGIINWKTFNIASGEVTQFIQPSAQSIILNRINDANPSQIFGSLLANGSVILLNPNGVLFGKGAQVNVNGLIASTLNLTDTNFLNGNLLLEGSGLGGFVKNEGTLKSATGGYVFLFAPQVENNGIIQSPEGQIYLGAGNSVYLSNNPIGSGFLVQMTAPVGETVNLSQLIANGGQVSLYGAAVIQKGLIQADSVRDQNGRIELYASKTLELGAGSRIEANGGEEIGQGGMVSVISDKTSGQTLFAQEAVIDISGGKTGGNGGSAEISGSQLTYGGTVIGTAAKGYLGGQLLLDPYDLTLAQTNFDQFSYSNLTSVSFQADHDINVTNVNSDFGSWAVNNRSTMPTLSFKAGNNINFSDVWLCNDGYSGTGVGPGWNFSAVAGGNINLTRTIIQTGFGNIALSAGANIELAGGSGGNYSYLWTAGGDIYLTAGGDLIAPTVYDSTMFLRYSGIRLDGGNLSATLGGNFTGGTIDGVLAPPGFILSNGTATIDLSQGGSFASSDNYGKITLGKGTINITSKKDIYLGNVQDEGLVEQDRAIVDPSNQVNLVSLTGDIHLKPFVDTNVITGNPNSTLGGEVSIYPASFSADAREGNIFIENILRFWPSLQGTLNFHAWGNIEGNNPNQPTNVMLAYPDPSKIIGLSSAGISDGDFFKDPSASSPPNQILNAGNPPTPILFKTDTGDIANLAFQFLTPVIQKEVTISAGRDLINFIAEIGITDTTSKAEVSAGRNMSFANGISSSVYFVGEGEADILAKGNLDLGTSNGIEDHFSMNPYLKFGSEHSGLLNIGIGGDLLMTKSKIWSYNGANIDIHGVNGNNTPVGGSVDVGSNAGAGNDLGIVTLRGGDIHILATGDVNVNASRVATISGGNITIVSTMGSINAGYGSPDAMVDFFFPISFDFISLKEVFGSVKVPGSGIFTFDKDDPNPLPPYPPYPTIFEVPFILKDVSLEALVFKIIKESVLGHDTSALLASYKGEISPQLIDSAYSQEKENFTKSWKLGNISLKAGTSIVIPPAGIRGKKITIDAPNLDLKGGQLSGDVTLVNVGQITGNTGSISGPVNIVGGSPVGAGPSLGSNNASSGSLGGLTGSTGGISSQVAAASAVASNSSSDSERSNSSESESIDQSSQGGTAESGASSPNSKDGTRRRGGGKKFGLKQGVIIEVDTEESKEGE